jgi:LysM repeat protein
MTRDHRHTLRILIILIVLAGFSLPLKKASARPYGATPYDLIATVNELRASYSLPALQINDTLMASAQAHSDYQAFIGYGTHYGTNGSDETDRAIVAGYGGGKAVICDEAYAYTIAATSTNTIVYEYWADYEHRDLVLLNTRYQDVGAGATEKDGLIYYTLDVCVISGEAGASPPEAPQPTSAGSVTPIPTQPQPGQPTQEIKHLVTVTPNADGSIVHIVQPGDTMWSIAIAYGMKIIDLATMNDISPSNPVIYVGERIIVRFAFTPTPTPTITNTPLPPTRTPRPSRTPRPTSATRTLAPTQTATAPPVLPAIPSLQSSNRHTIGIIIITVCALGLLLVFGLGRSKE